MENKSGIIKITYKGKKIAIDMIKELSINKNLIDTQTSEGPSDYGFICLLRDYQNNQVTQLEREKDHLYAKIWDYYKQSGSSSNDAAHYKVLSSDRYQAALITLEKEQYLLDKLNSFVKAYEAKLRQLQTLQANMRKQL